MSITSLGGATRPVAPLSDHRVASAFRAGAADLISHCETMYAKIARELFAGRGGNLAADPGWADYHTRIIQFRWMQFRHYAELVGETVPPCPPVSHTMTDFMNAGSALAAMLREAASLIESRVVMPESCGILSPHDPGSAPRPDGLAGDGKTFNYRGKSAILKQITYKFAAYMLDRKSAHFSDIIAAMNDGRGAAATTDKAVGNWKQDFNNALREVCYPKTLESDGTNRLLRWVDAA